MQIPSLIAISILLLFQDLHGQNVMISNSNEPNEPSIIMDPKNPNVLMAASNIDNYYFSLDSGYTWTEQRLTSNHGVWGDPCLVVDTASNFYFFHLSNPSVVGNWLDRIVCQKTSDKGGTWPTDSYAGLNDFRVQDKEWCAIDRQNNNMYVTWTQFDSYSSSNPLDSSVILFSKSLDGGNNWSIPIRISKVAGDCLDDDNTVEGAVPAVGPNGEIYVSWAGPNGLVFNKSLDQGNTWLTSETTICAIPGGWNYNISGIMRSNGLPITLCDVSNGPNRGTIYVNWSDQRNGIDNTDIWMVKSLDGGQTWTSPLMINTDASNRQQFFTWMTIDQTNGNLYAVFYDRSKYSDDSTDVVIAKSTDGGNSFENFTISESPFFPNDAIFFGDYTNITVHNGVVRPIWTRLNNGVLSVWTDVSNLEKPLKAQSNSNDLFSFENYPNPVEDYAFVSFKLRMNSVVNLTVTDAQGNILSTLIAKEIRKQGKYIERICLNELGLSKGLYFLKLEVDDQLKVLRQIKL